jgi:predicted ATPase
LSVLAEALAQVEKTDERYYEAELRRLKGELLLMQGDKTKAEGSFHKAIEVARRQQAKSWELRATVSLCRLWQGQGRMDKARHVLAEIYGWFSEGFDTPDLKEAKALLEELSSWKPTPHGQSAAHPAVAADHLRRGYAWRVLPTIVLVTGVSLARIGGG